MTLAYNAKRIGGILFEASDIADAKKAYAESREYYKKALLSDEVKPGSKEAELIEKEMATIPSFDRE